MDEKTAWENFVSTGSVRDYLNYCQAKVISQSQCQQTTSEDSYELQYRGTNIKGTDCGGK